MRVQHAGRESLCKSCMGLKFEHLLGTEGFLHVPYRTQLSDFGNDCRLCALIYSSITDVFSTHAQQPWWSNPDHRRFTILRGLRGKDGGLDHILVCCGFHPSGSEKGTGKSIFPAGTLMVGRLEVSTEEGNPAARFIKQRIIPREPGSESSWFMVNQLMNECTHHHPQCEAPRIVSLPTRILDVKADSDSLIFPLESNGRQGKYATLSYCWGGPQKTGATEGNWEELTRGILVSTLPKTIQDAVTITRKLGLQYLWIDALCIKQNSKEDWDLESSRMASIYGNAAITIAAAGGSDSDAGCFTQGNSTNNQEIDTFEMKLPNGNIGSVCISVQGDYLPSQDPLNGRAWALQERLLSPRLLVYSTGTIYWQCQVKVGRNVIGSVRLPRLFFEPPKIWDWDTPVSDEEHATLYTVWQQISMDYSRRSITYDRDSLSALSGLARRFQDVTGDEYLAGLWKKTLSAGLMWQVTGGIGARPSTYLAPTWSWLCMRTPIINRYSRYHSGQPCVEIIEAETTLASRDTTGPVLSGRITLRGQMRVARRKGKELWGLSARGSSLAGTVVLDFDSELVDALDGPLWCLSILRNAGLLLKSSGTNYQRVGIFFLDTTATGLEKTGKVWIKESETCTLTLV